MFLIETVSDLYVDACVRNEAGILMFLSVFGRDTAVRELMARIQLKTGEHGLRELKLKGTGRDAGQKHTVTIGNPDDLDKLTGRLAKCLYGNLTHAWIFDPAIRAPDKGAKQSWIIETRHCDPVQQALTYRRKVWQAVSTLSSVPLLPHWQDTVIEALGSSLVTEMGSNPLLSQPLGQLVAYRVHLEDDFPSRISTLIRQGILTLEPDKASPRLPLALRA